MWQMVLMQRISICLCCITYYLNLLIKDRLFCCDYLILDHVMSLSWHQSNLQDTFTYTSRSTENRTSSEMWLKHIVSCTKWRKIRGTYTQWLELETETPWVWYRNRKLKLKFGERFYTLWTCFQCASYRTTKLHVKIFLKLLTWFLDLATFQTKNPFWIIIYFHRWVALCICSCG